MVIWTVRAMRGTSRAGRKLARRDGIGEQLAQGRVDRVELPGGMDG